MFFDISGKIQYTSKNMFLLFQEQYSLQLQTLAEAQRTQGIDSVPQIISTAYFHLNF